MNGRYTPTTNGVRNRYIWWCQEHQSDRPATDFYDQFERWLTQHDAELVANAMDRIVVKAITGFDGAKLDDLGGMPDPEPWVCDSGCRHAEESQGDETVTYRPRVRVVDHG